MGVHSRHGAPIHEDVLTGLRWLRIFCTWRQQHFRRDRLRCASKQPHTPSPTPAPILSAASTLPPAAATDPFVAALVVAVWVAARVECPPPDNAHPQKARPYSHVAISSQSTLNQALTKVSQLPLVVLFPRRASYAALPLM